MDFNISNNTLDYLNEIKQFKADNHVAKFCDKQIERNVVILEEKDLFHNILFDTVRKIDDEGLRIFIYCDTLTKADKYYELVNKFNSLNKKQKKTILITSQCQDQIQEINNPDVKIVIASPTLMVGYNLFDFTHCFQYLSM